MALRRLSTSSIQTNGKSSKLWDQTTFQSGMFALATVNVPSGGAASVSFSGIPATYTHLQIRGIAKSDVSQAFLIRSNNDSTNSYYNHELIGDGNNASSTSRTPRTGFVVAPQGISATSNIFAGFVVDILDYTNTNKYKTFRALSGNDLNGSGYVWFNSGAYPQITAITQIDLVSNGSSFSQYSSFALYGIKAG